eukprot:scaffold15753_cov58-Phaeocystis_antarctica.AAC.5
MSSYTYEASTVFDQIESADPCTTWGATVVRGTCGTPEAGTRAAVRTVRGASEQAALRLWCVQHAGPGTSRVSTVRHRHEPRDHHVVVEAAEGRQGEVLAGQGWGGHGLLLVEQAGSSRVAAAPPLVHIAPPLVGHDCACGGSPTKTLQRCNAKHDLTSARRARGGGGSCGGGGEVALRLQQLGQAADGDECTRMLTAEGLAQPLHRLAAQRLRGGQVALFLQQRAEVVDGDERARMPIAERLTQPLQRLAVQRLCGGEVALGVQQRAEVVDGLERVRMPAAEGLAHPLQRLAVQRLSGGEVALGLQQRAKVADEGERGQMTIPEGLARRLKNLA